MKIAPHWLALLIGCSAASWPTPLRAQDAAPADRNAVNARTLPGDMLADSPVRFPEQGALPSKHPPDRGGAPNEATEKDYLIFRTPERSLEQIARIAAEMPLGSFTPPPNDWEHLRRTRRLLTQGGELRLLALGDSIVNDTMRSGWVAKLQEAYPKARLQASVYVRGGGGCQHYREEERVAKNILPRRPDLVLIGGISQRSVDDIREVIRQLRAGLPEVEILLFTGAFGTTDPRDEVALARAPHSGTGAYGEALRRLAREERCAYLDLTSPWAEYIRTSKRHPHLFYRDAVHANEYGEQMLGHILMAFWTRAEPVRLRVDFSKPDGAWAMPALALGQGGLQSDPMIEPHIKEIRQLRPRTIRLFLSEYYRILPDRGRYDWTRLDRELRAVRATGARPTLALAMK
ncbi:MAG: hypothetical protein JNL97_13095, partial [Verrucomicrobiales bacterium]|nr:hypothetical protein [Verrucomicrobiales bacterium]